MYNNNSNSHPDPFAGQYPTPPPPPPQPTQTNNESSHQVFQPQPVVYHHSDSFSQPIQDTYIPPPQPTMHLQEAYAPPPQPMHLQEPYIPVQPETYVPPQMRQDIYTPPERSDYYNHHQQQQPSYYNNGMADEERNVHGIDQYRNEQPLDEYLRQEREEYMKHELPKQTKNESNQVVPFYKKEDYDEPEKVPMVQQPILSRKERKKLKKEQDNQYQPYIVKPTLAPENEPESYKYRPSQQEGNRACCCYNPAITCCSFFCLLISIAFLAAGIALMIASKVVTDKCNNQCANMIDQAQNACGTICSKVLHDGMFYGGIVVAALAGIAVIWKLIMWTCAGYSKK
ncbi:hypothetical protein MFLAVUS_003802 [Mucor flavus]|uniref:Uncharacterized protein n=1 Tax=Mucor flavus TaxID=439312 RepID=A0ABP9YU65_9FUNG